MSPCVNCAVCASFNQVHVVELIAEIARLQLARWGTTVPGLRSLIARQGCSETQPILRRQRAPGLAQAG